MKIGDKVKCSLDTHVAIGTVLEMKYNYPNAMNYLRIRWEIKDHLELDDCTYTIWENDTHLTVID